MDDPKSKDMELTEDQRFRNSETSTIDPVHAVVRCVAEAGSSPMSASQILQTFSKAGNPRPWAGDELGQAIKAAIKRGLLEEVLGVGYRTTENGRSEIGPMLEMDLQYV